jgi:HNH endonuclease
MSPPRNYNVYHIKDVFNYNPETGVLSRATPYRGKLDCLTKTNSNGKIYYLATYAGMVDYAHRIIWAYMTGRWPESGVDHINGDGLDNRWINLRPADQKQNTRNKSPNRGSDTKGVERRGNRYRAHISIDGERRYLGNFSSKEEAQRAYNVAALEMFGEYARPVVVP